MKKKLMDNTIFCLLPYKCRENDKFINYKSLKQFD